MRSIKFRVFDKDYRKMHIVGKDGHDSLTCWDGKIQYYNLQNGEGSGEHGSYILMQYTGLTDKNGKGIYEGDIIEITDHPFTEMDYDGKYEVHYDKDTMELCCGNLLLFRMRHYAEVVGNIYEHPHLLEESK